MKIYISCLAVILFSVLRVFADEEENKEWGAITNNAQISIDLKGGKKQLSTNQLYSLTFHVKNASTNETFFFFKAAETEPNPSFSFVVTSPSGRDISPKPVSSWRRVSFVHETIPSGQTIKVDFRLNDICKLEEIGTYKVIAIVEIQSVTSHKVFKVISNPLLISVVP